ncbi:hypothetical protein [Saccharopolyspora shandongensis]|uniref:hypothetical protein n=1 Tax=Saccharopolyspora shandongensis TaxID=418495 RepID=UPI0033E4C538
MGEGRDPDAVEPDIDNTISGGNFNGPVGQFGFVHGDVHLNPPRSPEEAAFRARYMKKMQEEWDAQEKAKRDAENKPAVGGCAILYGIVFIVIFGFLAWSAWKAYDNFHREKQSSCVYMENGGPPQECPW